jgi:hypothetical protein
MRYLEDSAGGMGGGMGDDAGGIIPGGDLTGTEGQGDAPAGGGADS